MLRPADITLLILHDYGLPAGYSAETVELLLVVPDQYPDAPLDMWWVHPWINFASGARPAAADVPQVFSSFEPEPTRIWQRFSRHPVWRDSDDLRTFLAVMRSTFEREANAARAS